MVIRSEGRVQIYEATLAIVRPELEAGKIKLLAMTNSVRTPAEPNVSTIKEAGYPALTLDGLVGLFGPPPAYRFHCASALPRIARRSPTTGAQYRWTGGVRKVDR